MKSEFQGSGIPSLLYILIPILFIHNSPDLQGAFYVCAYQMLLIFIKSTFFNHLSAGDEIWSTAPILYAFLLNSWTPRSTLQFILITIWGVRLSYNLWRKGGYRGLEDYRWLEVKKRYKNPLAWQLFRILFLCIYQMVINFQLALPVYYSTPGALTTPDYIHGVIALASIIYQAIADQQQWDFQLTKKKGGKEENSIGFVRTGLWKYSRHPNYFAELSFWWSIFFISFGLNWGVAGALTMTLAFQRVIFITEKQSASKYPLYKSYQASTSKIIPWPPSSN